MNKLVKEELDAMKYLLGYQRGKVISEQAQVSTPAAAPQTVEDVVKQIQTTLNTKYGTKLTVDGKWGNLTQTAFETAIKSKGSAPKSAAPAATTGTTLPTVTVTGATAPAAPIAAAPNVPLPSVNTPAAPGVSGQPAAAAPVAAAPAAENPADVVGTEVAQPTARDQRRERQDLRRANRRAMQDLRTQQRAQ